MTADIAQTRTEVGNYFVSNYPPFSQWKPEFVTEAIDALNQPARVDDPLGLYIHIPFCRKRCLFCYFKVYTDKNSSEIEVYLDALIKENELYSRSPGFQGRKLRFAYFGGGTPSYISEKQLRYLVDGLNRHVSWQNAEEVTFECEPGTIQKAKLETLKAIGVTRLSLGIEHFDDEILAANGRAHLSPEIYRAYEWAREVDFPQINIDLIAGMSGETEEKWREAVRRAIELQPDSVTIYQMELPYNTVISQDILKKGAASPIAGWDTKRRWLNYAFEQFLAHDYDIGIGVSSFSHFGGVNFQNVHNFEEYVRILNDDRLPLLRAVSLTPKQRLIREMVLQLKTGSLDADYFQQKFGVDVWNEFRFVFEELEEKGLLRRHNRDVALTRDGLLQVDHFLPEFFEPELRTVRYA